MEEKQEAFLLIFTKAEFGWPYFLPQFLCKRNILLSKFFENTTNFSAMRGKEQCLSEVM